MAGARVVIDEVHIDALASQLRPEEIAEKATRIKLPLKFDSPLQVTGLVQGSICVATNISLDSLLDDSSLRICCVHVSCCAPDAELFECGA
eukprot:50056-Eustigmatos_ZCMA.PRE.1